MGCHSAPGLFCSLPTGLSCLLSSLGSGLAPAPTTVLLSQLLPWQSCRATLGHWESSSRVSLELDKAPGAFETHHWECWSESPAPGYGFMECQRSAAGTIPDIVPLASSWHFAKQSFLGWLFPGFHGQLPTMWDQPDGSSGLQNSSAARERGLGLLCPGSVLHCSSISGSSTCPARVWSGRAKAQFCQTKRGFERLDIIQGGDTNPRQMQVWNLWGFAPRVCVEVKTVFNYHGLSTSTALFSHTSPKGCWKTYSRWDSSLLTSKLAGNVLGSI